METINIVFTSLLCISMMIIAGCGRSRSVSPSVSGPKVSDDNTSITTADGGALFDPDTELQTGIIGFSVRNVYIVDGNDKKISKSEVALNTTFSIVYDGVNNYTLTDGRAFPNITVQVIDNDQGTIMAESDLFASYTDGLTEEDASVLRATIAVADPMKPGKYICSVHVEDKNNASATILSTWNFEVK